MGWGGEVKLELRDLQKLGKWMRNLVKEFALLFLTCFSLASDLLHNIFFRLDLHGKNIIIVFNSLY